MQKYLSNQFICPDHNELMNLVCLDQNCQKNGLICSHCQHKQHKHPVRAFRMLLAEIEKDMGTYETNLMLLSQIDQTFVEIEEELNKISAAADKKSVRQVALNYFQFQVASLFKRIKIVQQLQDKKQKSIQQMNQFIKRYNFVDKSANPNSYTNSEHEMRARLEQLKNAQKEIKQLIKNNDSIDKIMRIFEITEDRKVKYYFNSEKCHRDIIIVDKVKAQLKQGYSYRIGTIDPPIRKQGAKTKRKTCVFKITKVTAMVGVGVIYRKKAETANFLFSAYSQHGCYLSTNSGYTYNESNSAFNSQIKNWSFTTNDIVKVTIEPKQKKILFQKQGKDVFELPYEEKPDQELSFGFLLCQQHQGIQLLHG